MSTMTTTKHKSKSGCGCGGHSSGSGGCSCGCKSGPCECETCDTGGYVRPRFFAGQLLTEDDLQLLERYVIQKNRLHNRHFFGEGVVCGMEVHCDPCSPGKVIVEPGYALDCCGNDIVLECPQTVNILAMIRELRRKTGQDCGDPCPPQETTSAEDVHAGDAADAKDDADKQDKKPLARHYCLYIRYCERESDPTSPYSTDEPCGVTNCEATRVHEGFRFELRCCPKEPDHPTFAKSFIECMGRFAAAQQIADFAERDLPTGVEPPPGESSTTTPPKSPTLVDLQEAMLDVIDGWSPAANCRLRRQIEAASTDEQSPTAKADLQKLANAIYDECFCRALLPQCWPCDDQAVLLACLSVEECEVTAICNLVRTIVLTGVALRYWLPIDLVFEYFARYCCGDIPCSKKEEEEEEEVDEAEGGSAIYAGLMRGATRGLKFRRGEMKQVQSILGRRLRDTFAPLRRVASAKPKVTEPPPTAPKPPPPAASKASKESKGGKP